jgi:hypothetical protein
MSLIFKICGVSRVLCMAYAAGCSAASWFVCSVFVVEKFQGCSSVSGAKLHWIMAAQVHPVRNVPVLRIPRPFDLSWPPWTHRSHTFRISVPDLFYFERYRWTAYPCCFANKSMSFSAASSDGYAASGGDSIDMLLQKLDVSGKM